MGATVETDSAAVSLEFSDTGFSVPSGQLAECEVYAMLPSRSSPVAARPVTANTAKTDQRAIWAERKIDGRLASAGES